MKIKFDRRDRVMHVEHGEVEIIQAVTRDSIRGYVVRAVHFNENTNFWYHDGTRMKRRAYKFWAPFYELSEIRKG